MLYHVMFIPVFGRKQQIHYLLGKLNEFHMCDTTFPSMSRRLLETFYSKVTLIQAIFGLFCAKLLFCIHYLDKLQWMTCYHFFFFYLMMKLICWRAYLPKNQGLMIFQVTSFMNFLNNIRFDLQYERVISKKNQKKLQDKN